MTSILIVDDSAAMRQHLRECLEDVAEPEDVPEIAEASSGLEALRLLPRARYDAIVTDISMPNLDGMDLLRFVRQSDNRDAALIIVSNISSDRERDRSLQLGADGFLAKPVVPEILRETVARAIKAAPRAAFWRRLTSIDVIEID